MCFHEVIQHLLCFGSSHIHQKLSPVHTRRSAPSTPPPVAQSGAAMPSPPTPRRRRSVSSTPSPVARSGVVPPPPTPRRGRSVSSTPSRMTDESPGHLLDPLPAIMPLIQPSMQAQGVDATAGAAVPQFQMEVSLLRPKWRRLRRKTQVE